MNRDYLGVGEGHDDERNDKLHHRRDSAVNLSIVIRRPVDLTNVYRNNNDIGIGQVIKACRCLFFYQLSSQYVTLEMIRMSTKMP